MSGKSGTIDRILLVCTGNICRSPMAEGWFRAQLQNGAHSLQISSAGLAALIGKPADPAAVELLASRQIDISTHRARQLTVPMIKETDLILVMESWQRRAVYDMLPSACGRVHLIGQRSGIEIMDPYQKDLCEFERTLCQIITASKDWQYLWNVKDWQCSLDP